MWIWSWILFLIFILTSLFSQNFQVLLYQFALSQVQFYRQLLLSLVHNIVGIFHSFSCSLYCCRFDPHLLFLLSIFPLPSLYPSIFFLSPSRLLIPFSVPCVNCFVVPFRSALFSSTFWSDLIPKKKKKTEKKASLSRYVYASLSQIVFFRFFWFFLSESFDLMDVFDLEQDGKENTKAFSLWTSSSIYVLLADFLIDPIRSLLLHDLPGFLGNRVHPPWWILSRKRGDSRYEPKKKRQSAQKACGLVRTDTFIFFFFSFEMDLFHITIQVIS